jgi:tyrosyl-tRNA synthetase
MTPAQKVDARPEVVDRVLTDFKRTTDEMFSLEELRQRMLSGRQLILKYGVDVTAPTIHIGHAVNMWMLRRMQELGHKVIFLIGDFTTRIGDPTGKNKTRPVIPDAEIQKNAESFIAQAMMVLHDRPDQFEVRRNSEWYGPMPTEKFLSLVSMVTYARLAARDMFRNRVEAGQDVYMHEMLYPILQGYDSVMLKSDLTIIGSDQLYNEMMGRFYQEKVGEPPQVIITTKITPGLTGVEKQSKSLDNYIGLGHAPREKFGRVMTLPDNLITQYFEVYTDVPMADIEAMERLVKEDPRACKLRLAREIVARYHGEDVAKKEEDWFVQTFTNKVVPDEIKTVAFPEASVSGYEAVRACLPAAQSNSVVRRLLLQGAVKAGDTIVTFDDVITLPATLKVGKRQWFKLVQG